MRDEAGVLRRGGTALLAVLVLALVLPTVANAEEIKVDSTADEADLLPGAGGCLTAAGKCTLRAAIEESNAATGTSDEITFDKTIFNGQTTSTILLSANLPAIVKPVRIDGGECQTEIGVSGPCVGIQGTNSGRALPVEADEVDVEGLDVFASRVGIAFIGSRDFKVLRDWFGVRLDGKTLEQEDDTAVRAGPGSENGWIGGKEAGMGNLFVHGSTGLEIFGASQIHVLGNRFGIEPDGGSQWAAGGLGEGIKIVSAPLEGFEALGNTIGTELSEAAVATPACDGGCNLISGAAEGIKLWAEGSAYGPPVETTIVGNNIGLNVAGTGLISTIDGIRTGSAPRTVVGGPAIGDANRINVGGRPISGGSPELLVIGNLIGVNAEGTEIIGAPSYGITLYSGFTDPTLEAAIVENEIGLKGGRGITNQGLGATIAGNEIVGAEHGIYTNGDSGALGNLIEGNLIEASEAAGIYLENSRNEIYGNELIESGGAGIYVAGTTENRVGSNTEASENEIDFGGGPAVSIYGEGTESEVARNHGFGNEGPFIQLQGLDPNGGIEPPAISAATATSASGSGAEPGALVRVFRNEFEDEGELGSFLGQAGVNSQGDWTVEYPAIPAGSFLAATQTLAGGTSELAMAATPPAPGGGTGAGGGGAPGGQGVTTRPTEQPNTTLQGTAFAARLSRVKRGRVLLRLRCLGAGPCSGVAKLIARTGSKRLVIGKSPFRIPAGRAAVVGVKLNGKGKALLRKAGRHGLRVKLGGRGVKPRPVVLKAV